MSKKSEALKSRRNDLYRRFWNAQKNFKLETPDLESFDLPDGDFDYSSMEAGDWHVFCCGEKDCPVQWHKVAYATDLVRKNGVLTITENSVDSDGNWDFNDEWTDENEVEQPFADSDIARSMARNNFEFFQGWAEYWLDCAASMQDPVGDSIANPGDMMPSEWYASCLDSAEQNIKYMEPTKQEFTK